MGLAGVVLNSVEFLRLADAGLRHRKAVFLFVRILRGYHDPWHSRSHASLVQINVFHLFLVEELLEHVDPVSLQIGHQCLLQAVSRLLHFPLVLADHCLLESSVKSEERLLIVVGHVVDVDVRLWTMGSESQHAASAWCAVRLLQLCLGGEAHAFLV